MNINILYEDEEVIVCEKPAGVAAQTRRLGQADMESLTVRDFKADRIVQVSAKTGEGLEALLQAIEEILREQKIYIERVYSYQESGKIQLIRKYGELLEEEYKEDGIHVSAYVPKELDGRV